MFVLLIIEFPFLVLAFSDSSSLRTHFWPSLRYCVKFGDRLREKFGFLTEGNEGSEDPCGYGLDFLQKATKRTKIFAAAEDKAFVSFVVFCLESSPVRYLLFK
jgi:hypothetical protein